MSETEDFLDCCSSWWLARLSFMLLLCIWPLFVQLLLSSLLFPVLGFWGVNADTQTRIWTTVARNATFFFWYDRIVTLLAIISLPLRSNNCMGK